jgi:hypothetical protein
MSKSKTPQNKPSRKIARRGEKVNKETNAALSVKPERAPRPAPTVGSAIDRRKQIVGTYEPKGRSRR